MKVIKTKTFSMGLILSHGLVCLYAGASQIKKPVENRYRATSRTTDVASNHRP